MILVLVSPRQQGLDLTASIPEAVDRCLVLTGGPVPIGAERVAAMATIDRYDDDTIVDAARRLARGRVVRRVVSFAEADVRAAARLRDLWDLPGQRPDSASAYRDKLLMRSYAAAAGLPGPAVAAVETAGQVADFAAAYGLPVVVKPRDASGSVGLRVLREPAEVAALPQTLSGHLVEEFVPGEVVHVDGVWAAGRPILALPARYTELGCLAHLSDLGGGSALLPRRHPWYEPLRRALWQVVAALPAADDLLLHAEFFVAHDGVPVLCEVASRLPGHPIPPMLDRALGTSLRSAWLRLAAGLPVDLDDLARRGRDAAPVANFGLPPLRGELCDLPAGVPDGCAGWLHDLWSPAAVGEVWDDDRYAARKSGDFVLTWTVSAPDADLLAERLDESVRLLAARVRWREPERAGAGAR